jgi:hypothetical protein
VGGWRITGQFHELSKVSGTIEHVVLTLPCYYPTSPSSVPPDLVPFSYSTPEDSQTTSGSHFSVYFVSTFFKLNKQNSYSGGGGERISSSRPTQAKVSKTWSQKYTQQKGWGKGLGGRAYHVWGLGFNPQHHKKINK